MLISTSEMIRPALDADLDQNVEMCSALAWRVWSQIWSELT